MRYMFPHAIIAKIGTSQEREDLTELTEEGLRSV